MNKNKKPLVPRLRFPEFKNCGAWEERRLGEYIQEQVNRNRELKCTDVWSVNNRLGFISQSDQFELREVASKDLSNYKLIFKNMYAYNPSRINVGSIARSSSDNIGIVSPMYICFSLKDGLETHFFDQYLQTFIFKNSVKSNTSGSVRDSLNLSALSNFKILLPNLKEQQKIAACLSSLDSLITAEAQKLEALNRHKKGLMQKLFPAKGKTTPQWRFPEFKNCGAWEERRLGEVATVVMGASPKSEFYNNESEGLPLLQGNADIKNRVSAPRIFTSQVIQECQKGDILMSVRAPVGNISKSIHHACIGRGIAAIRINQNNTQEFLFQWLLAFEQKWQSISQGGIFDAVSSNDIRKLSINLPLKPEQQKIAACLSSLDSLITAEAQKLEALKNHKKALMQGLFPQT